MPEGIIKSYLQKDWAFKIPSPFPSTSGIEQGTDGTITLTSGTNTASMGQLTMGDANGDNFISILDFSILAAAFNTQTGDPTFDIRADFNGDGFVTALDFSVLAFNFNTAGEFPSN